MPLGFPVQVAQMVLDNVAYQDYPDAFSLGEIIDKKGIFKLPQARDGKVQDSVYAKIFMGHELHNIILFRIDKWVSMNRFVSKICTD